MGGVRGGGGSRGGVQGGGVMVEQIFSKKLVFEKKTAERVAGVLARNFHPPTRG